MPNDKWSRPWQTTEEYLEDKNSGKERYILHTGIMTLEIIGAKYFGQSEKTYCVYLNTHVQGSECKSLDEAKEQAISAAIELAKSMLADLTDGR